MNLWSHFSLPLVSLSSPGALNSQTIIPPFSKPVRYQPARVTGARLLSAAAARTNSQLSGLFFSFFFLLFPGGLEPKKLTYIKSKTRATPSRQKEGTRLQLANCKAQVTRLGSLQTLTLPPFDALRLRRRAAERPSGRTKCIHDFAIKTDYFPSN